ncbi:MAG: branched-chain amino acid ABC transporter permease [Acidimicrobiales bacterium]
MTKLAELVFAGTTRGALYALVALGFVVIYRSTGVINFAQGGLLLLGTYLTYNAHVTWGLPFWLAVVVAAALTALTGVLVERTVLRRMVGQPVFAVVMVTLGLLIIVQQVVPVIWGYGRLDLGDPWGLRTMSFGGIDLQLKDLWTLGLAAAVLAAFFTFFRFSRYGVAMRATAFDQEAALAQGISARQIFALSWAIAGVVATLAGVMLAAGSGGVEPGQDIIALAAFPAIILGGLDSPLGAVVGGLVIGVSQALTAGYQPEHAAFLGDSFDTVMPYVVMVLILLVRPSGLFGTREVSRV